jgi:tetratricopeptide (TPR) repeat protein
LARERLTAGEREEALASATSALRLSPDDPEALTLHARSLLDLRRHREALADAERLVELNSESADAWALRAWVESTMGPERARDAVFAAAQALVLDSRCALAYAAIASAELGRTRFKESYEAAERALAIDPDMAKALRLRGSARYYLLRDAGQPLDAAYADLERAVEIDPHDVSTWHMLGFFAFQERRYEQAERYLDRAVAGRDHTSDHFYRGWSRMNLGELDGAEEDFTRGLEIGIENQIARCYALRSSVRYQRGRLAEAAADAKRGLEAIRPDTEPWVRPWLERILTQARSR